LALPVEQAAESLGLSQSHFRQHVLPHIRSIKVGRVRIVPVIELERWLYLSGRFADESSADPAPWRVGPVRRRALTDRRCARRVRVT
jgi:hypothetical protein